jgi:hypothetical protein
MSANNEVGTMITKWNFRIFAAAVALLLVMAMGVPAFAQQSIGTILGVVKDTSGGTVPQAKVTVTNTETNESRTVDTGDDGAYRFPALKPGHYVLKIEKDGFKTQTETGLTLDVAQELVVNSAMEVGSATQEVTVTGEAPLVNTTTSALGSLVNEEKMADLPLNGRNYVDLTLIQPGVNQQLTSTGGGAGISGTWFSANGAPARSNNFSLDGAPTVNAYGASSGSMNGTTLGVDGIREYKVVTSAYSAEYGMTMGAQMVIVSKGGTNQFHGDVFEYLRNDHLDARNFFDSPTSAGLTAAGAQRRLPLFQRNNFGGSFGGPIKKDRTFFYGVYEGLRLNQGLTVLDTTIPTSCHNLVANGSAFAFATPADAAACGGFAPAPVAQPVIPANMVQFINLYPNCNIGLPSCPTTNNYSTPASSQQSENYGQMRVDQTISTSDSFFGRYTIDQGFINNASSAAAVPPSGTVSSFPQFFRILGESRNQFLSLGETHIISPTLLNTARISYSRTNFDAQNLYSAAFKALNIPSFVPAGLPMGGVSISGGYTGMGPNTGYPTFHVQNIYTASDDVFYTKGRHALKFGMLFNRYNSDSRHTKLAQGTVSFSSLALFMQGIYNTYTSLAGYTPPPVPAVPPAPNLVRDWLYNTFGFYGQDDFRATSRLTLNLGFRYEFQTTPNDQGGIQARFVNIQDITQSPSTLGYTFGPPIKNPGLKNFSPRVGFAWDVFGTGRTSVRSGFGIYYDVGNIGAALEQEANAQPPYSVQYQVNTNQGAGGSGTISFPFCYSSSAPCGVTQSSVAGLQTINYNTKNPYSFQYNLTIEQQLPGGIGLAVSYVGLQGRNLWATSEANAEVPNATAPNGGPMWNNFLCPYTNTTTEALTKVPNPSTACPAVPGSTVAKAVANAPLAGSAAATNCLLATGTTFYERINPCWSSDISTGTTSKSWYNSLQVVVNKRLSRGLEFQTSYTYSKGLDTTQGQMFGSDCGASGALSGIDPFSTTYDKGPSCSDATHILHFSLLYHIPNVKSDNAFVKEAVNGWWLGNIVNVQTGFPFTPTLTLNRSNSGVLGSTGDRPDLVGTSSMTTFSCTGNTSAFPTAPACNGANATAKGTVTYTYVPFNASTVTVGDPNEWFNPLMFQLAPAGTLGDASRDMLRGPGSGTWNLSINKDTRVRWLGEKGALQFRAEIFNLLNRANFSIPSGTVFTGTQTDAAGQTEAPLNGVAKISTTQTSSRQVQLALKMIF